MYIKGELYMALFGIVLVPAVYNPLESVQYMYTYIWQLRRKLVESAGTFCQWRSINPTQGGRGQETLVHCALKTLMVQPYAPYPGKLCSLGFGMSVSLQGSQEKLYPSKPPLGRATSVDIPCFLLPLF